MSPLVVLSVKSWISATVGKSSNVQKILENQRNVLYIEDFSKEVGSFTTQKKRKTLSQSIDIIKETKGCV